MKRIPVDLVDRYIAGDCSERDRAQMEQWLVKPGHRILLEAFRENVQYHEGAPDSTIRNENVAWKRIQHRTRLGAHASTRVLAAPESGRRDARAPWGRWSLQGGIFKAHPLRRSLWFAAGGFVLGAMVILAGWKLGGVPLSRQSSYTTYTTTNGQRATITLADGSTVALNVASRLDVPVDYGDANRTLRLWGEGLFTVVHHGALPFTVRTGGVVTKVLGTNFVVRHYATDSATTVDVREGKVAVQSRSVAAGQQLIVNQTGATQLAPSDAANFSFAAGALTLNGVLLPQAIPELDRWYGTDIRLGSPTLNARRIKGKLLAGSLTDLTDLLQLTYDVRVVRDGRVLTLFPR